MLAVYAVVAPVAFSFSGARGLWAAAAAATFCLAGAGTALATSQFLRKPKYLLHGVLAATAARMGIPLTLGLICHIQGGPLAEAGLLYYLLAFYPVALAVETALSLPGSNRPGKCHHRKCQDVPQDMVS